MSEEFNKVIIGTHNSMSFLKPKHWWMRPINWLFAQCQHSSSANNEFVKCVDIRVYWDKKKGWSFAHGLASYEFNNEFCSIYATINKFILSDVRYFRIILERDGNEDGFVELCNCLECKYKALITFLGGYRKSDWKQLYDFGTNDIPIHQWVGSMADDARWYEKFIPRLYAKRMNKHNIKNAKTGINLYDFL